MNSGDLERELPSMLVNAVTKPRAVSDLLPEPFIVGPSAGA